MHIAPDGTYITADKRTIVHVMTHDGERGKSTYIKHIVAKHGAVLIDYENPTNVKCLLAGKQTKINGLGRSAIIAIDVPRSVSLERKEFYTLVECVKDGHFMSGKYKPTEVKFDMPPHVYVFSNELLAVQHMSPDKFECFTVDNDDKLVRNPLMLKEQITVANEQYKRQQHLLKSIRTEVQDGMDRLFDACFEVEKGNEEKWHVAALLAALKEQAGPAARLPALGGPVALGLWLKKRFPPGHDAVERKHDVRGNYYTGLARKPAAAASSSASTA